MKKLEKLDRLPPYVFAEVNRIKDDARSKGKDIIDFGMGNPDSPTPKHIVDKLIEAVQDPKSHRYSSSKGISGLRKAQANYYERRFNVKLNYETEVVATLGSKEGLANMAQVLSVPSDTFLVPNPAYPIHAFGFIISGANLIHYRINEEIDLMTEIAEKVESSKTPVKAIVINFPSNPTARICSRDFYKEIVSYAINKDIMLLSDLAYSEIYFDEEDKPTSILEIDGAKDVAVEFTSMSKTFSMPGWRMGFAVGNEYLISALTRIKSYLDYGAFTPIQVASVTALNSHEKFIDDIRMVYKERRDILIESFSNAGWNIPAPKATMFAWSPIPEKFKEMTSLEFSKLLLEKADIAVSPGLGFGEYGEGFVRLSMVENEQRVRQAARNLRKIMK
ncbi:MAG: aminotransferase class I/II-fold pyridoxal phosphate-dependent enzyme [Alphaproteobacteria bacterium]|jgi:alanine-synthesizing transaminase